MQEATVVAATIAALASIITLILNTRLSETRDKRRIAWSREFERFFALEEVAGQLVQDLLGYGLPSIEKIDAAQERRENLRASAGRFLRYPDVSAALIDLHKSTGWYFSDHAHYSSPEEVQAARADISRGFEKLIGANDRVLGRSPPWWKQHFS